MAFGAREPYAWSVTPPKVAAHGHRPPGTDADASDAQPERQRVKLHPDDDADVRAGLADLAAGSTVDLTL